MLCATDLHKKKRTRTHSPTQRGQGRYAFTSPCVLKSTQSATWQLSCAHSTREGSFSTHTTCGGVLSNSIRERSSKREPEGKRGLAAYIACTSPSCKNKESNKNKEALVSLGFRREGLCRGPATKPRSNKEPSQLGFW